MTINEILEEQIILEKNRYKQNAAERAARVQEKRKHRLENRPGRVRLVSTICNAMEKRGVSHSRQSVAHVLDKLFVIWANNPKDPRTAWVRRIAYKAQELGFNPYSYINQEPLQSSGKSNKGQPEYSGRAYFFVAFTNEFIHRYKNDTLLKTKSKAKKDKKNK